MFYKEIQQEKNLRSAFLEHLEAQILSPTMMALSQVPCVYRSAQKSSGYITAMTLFDDIRNWYPRCLP